VQCHRRSATKSGAAALTRLKKIPRKPFVANPVGAAAHRIAAGPRSMRGGAHAISMKLDRQPLSTAMRPVTRILRCLGDEAAPA
jgi:hypothetical protein